jgi:hypothetical protein
VRSCVAVVLAVVASVAVGHAKALGPRLDAPSLSTGGSTATSIDVTVCAGSSGAPAGFGVQWEATADYTFHGWDDSSTTFGAASFAGGAAGSPYALAAFECLTVSPGNLPADDGQGGTTAAPGPLACGTNYVFRAFAHVDATGLGQSDFSATYSFGTSACPPPYISYAVTPSPNASGWNNSLPVDVDWTVASFLPAVIDSGCVDETFNFETAGEMRSCSAHNDAGSAEPATVTIRIDSTKPGVAIVCPAGPVLLNAAAGATWSASDDGSGLITAAGAIVLVDTSAVGPKSASAPTAIDAAGNSSDAVACSYTVAYDWSGFFQPVDNLPTLNVARAGSAIPVIFSLGGNQGLNVVSVGYPTSNEAACDASAGDDIIEATVSAGNSSLAYDPITNRYTYVWKTEKAWAGTCRQLRLKLVDGTLHVANFRFRT